MKIEKLEPFRHKQGRWLAWLDDASIVRVGEGDVVSLGLYPGKELTGAEDEALCAAGERFRLMERAVALLAQRPMSRKELLDKLCAPPRQKREKYPYDKLDDGPDPALLEARRKALRERAEEVADRLTELGLLNDEACRVQFFLDQAFADAPGLIGVHPNDNTATVWLRTEDLLKMIEQHGNVIHVTGM